MGIGYASRNRQERKGGVRWNRLSNRCQTIRSSPLLGFRQGVQRWLGEDRCGAPPLRIVPTHPASSRSGCCTRVCTRSCSSVSSIAEPAKTPTQCGGGGSRTHGELAPSRLIPPHRVSFRPVGCTRGVRDASTSMNVKPALMSGRGRGSHLVEEAERVHAIRTYSSASWSGSGSAPHERGPRRRRRPPDVLVPSRDG